MTPEPYITAITHDLNEYQYWVLMRYAAHKAPVFVAFRHAGELLQWYADGAVSEGEEGRDFSRFVLAWCKPYDELKADVDADE